MQLTNAYRLQKTCAPVSIAAKAKPRPIETARTLQDKLDAALIDLEAERAKRRAAEAEAIAFRAIVERKPLKMETPASAILSIVAGLAGVTPGNLAGPRRSRCYAVPRQAAMLLLRRHTAAGKASMTEIGRSFSGRDHTTVLHGILKAEWRIKNEPDFAELVAKAEAMILGKSNG